MENQVERDRWLDGLTVLSPVVFHSPAGWAPGIIWKIDRVSDAERLWVRVPEISPAGSYYSWVWRDGGHCPSAGIWIEPA